MSKIVEKFVMEDGRQAEKHITEDGNQRVVEIHVEPAREKNLSHRVIEKSANVVVRRELEVIDEKTGEIIEKKVESIDPAEKMELREFIVKSDPLVSAQSVEEHCYVTKEDLDKLALAMAAQTKDAIIAASKVLANHQDDRQVSAMQIAVGEKVEATTTTTNSIKDNLVYIGIAAVAAGIVYVQWYM